MLPACRTGGEGFAIPTFDLVPSDVEGFMEELWEFQSTFHDCFARSEPRGHFFDYMVGQFSKLERKSIEPMAIHVDGGTIWGLQRFISDVVWDDEQMRWNYHQLVTEEMGAPDGVLMFDETGFVKKGKDSVGGARQYCGENRKNKALFTRPPTSLSPPAASERGRQPGRPPGARHPLRAPGRRRRPGALGRYTSGTVVIGQLPRSGTRGR